MRTHSTFTLARGITFFVMLSFATVASAQHILDLSVGTSFQDHANAQMAFRRQIGDRFQTGIELQYGLPKYRFVETKAMRAGYAMTASAPFSLRLALEDNIQLYGIGRVGARLQGIIDPDDNDMQDSTLASSALVTEIGLITTFKAGDKINVQGGMSFPMAFEVSPLSLQEYTWVKIHLGASRDWDTHTFFAHGNIGSAFGASGDTYKYIWSLEAGVRFHFGDPIHNHSLVHTSI